MTCAFTGHRPSAFSFGYEEYRSSYFRFYEALYSRIEDLMENGYDTFYTGMAEGVDIWAAEAVLTMKKEGRSIRLVSVVPFPGQDRRMSVDYQKRYRAVLAGADEVVCTSNEYTKESFRIRNYYLVDHADLLFAVYNREETRSGTGQTIRYAQKKGVSVLVLDPVALTVEKC